MEYGDLKFKNEDIEEFQGNGKKNSEFESMLDSFWGQIKNYATEQMGNKNLDEEYETERKNIFAVNSRDIKLHYLYQDVTNDPSEQTHQALKAELDNRMRIENVFETAFGNHMQAVRNGTYPVAEEKEHFDCYGQLIQSYQDSCGLDEYALKFMGAFISECAEIKDKPEAIDSAMDKIKNACTE